MASWCANKECVFSKVIATELTELLEGDILYEGHKAQLSIEPHLCEVCEHTGFQTK